MPVLGLDTSNYTTSAALFDIAAGRGKTWAGFWRCAPAGWGCARATPCSSM